MTLTSFKSNQSDNYHHANYSWLGLWLWSSLPSSSPLLSLLWTTRLKWTTKTYNSSTRISIWIVDLIERGISTLAQWLPLSETQSPSRSSRLRMNGRLEDKTLSGSTTKASPPSLSHHLSSLKYSLSKWLLLAVRQTKSRCFRAADHISTSILVLSIAISLSRLLNSPLKSLALSSPLTQSLTQLVPVISTSFNSLASSGSTTAEQAS